MPCRDYMDDTDYRAQRARDEQEKRDYLTRIACRFAKALENGETLDWMILQGEKGDKRTKEALDWWKEHKRKDEEARLARKALKDKKAAEAALRKSITEKLTVEEQKFLEQYVKEQKQSPKVSNENQDGEVDIYEVIKSLQLGQSINRQKTLTNK